MTIRNYKKTALATMLLASILIMSFNPLDVSEKGNRQDHSITLPLGGNTWRSDAGRSGGNVTNNGIENWTDKQVGFDTYVRLTQAGTLKLSLRLSVPDGQSKIGIIINKDEKELEVQGSDLNTYPAGEWQIDDTGYIKIHIQGLSKTGKAFANVQDMQLDGTAVNEHTAYVKNNEGNFFYWGRRGPSVHETYILPKDKAVEWFYNEVTVPVGNDVLGSYFMADGFGEGYFGMQVNSPSTRHILFSVWSPFSTNDPNEIPDSMKIQLLAKGNNVHAGEFGNEGSGGQSYMNYPWKAGTTYKFLLHAVPDDVNHTTYTAYFYAPEAGKWQLIASFRRPQTNTYLKHLHSFLENFSPEQGNRERQVLFGNQWICTHKGQWIELNKMYFTTDDTGRKGYRMDYAGGVKDGKFFLQNCGFFNSYTPADSQFERPLTANKPVIDFKNLPTH